MSLLDQFNAGLHGDTQAMVAFYERAVPLLRSYMHSTFPRLKRDEIDDIIQDTIIKLWDIQDSFQAINEDALKAWLFQTANRKGIDAVRAKNTLRRGAGKKRASEQALLNYTDDITTFDRVIDAEEQKERRQEWNRFLETRAGRTQLIFRLRNQGKKNKEILTALNTSGREDDAITEEGLSSLISREIDIFKRTHRIQAAPETLAID